MGEKKRCNIRSFLNTSTPFPIYGLFLLHFSTSSFSYVFIVSWPHRSFQGCCWVATPLNWHPWIACFLPFLQPHDLRAQPAGSVRNNKVLLCHGVIFIPSMRHQKFRWKGRMTGRELRMTFVVVAHELEVVPNTTFKTSLYKFVCVFLLDG